jgi:hypothetical protein
LVAGVAQSFSQACAAAQLPVGAIISGTTAVSFTGTTLATIAAVRSGISELASPSTSSAPAGATTPESQLVSTSWRGPWRNRSRS